LEKKKLRLKTVQRTFLLVDELIKLEKEPCLADNKEIYQKYNELSRIISLVQTNLI